MQQLQNEATTSPQAEQVLQINREISLSRKTCKAANGFRNMFFSFSYFALVLQLQRLH
jgi:hypothetical protein